MVTSTPQISQLLKDAAGIQRERGIDGVSRHITSSFEFGTTTEALVDLSQWVEIAQALGFSICGVSETSPFEAESAELEQFAAEGLAGSMDYLTQRSASGELLRSDPRNVWSKASSALVVGLPYAGPNSKTTEKSKVAAYAQGADYHLVIRDKLLSLADALAYYAQRDLEFRVCVDSAPLLERQLLARSKAAFIGKNTLALAPGWGSYFLIGVMLTPFPVGVFEKPASLVTGLEQRSLRGCGDCRACLDACPTGALFEAYRIDPRRCISYLTIESAAPIAPELQPFMEDHLFGCDDCQSVCPFNQGKNAALSDPQLEARPAVKELSADELLELGSSQYKRLVKGSSMRRASRNQLARNAALALGNQKQESSSALEYAAENHSSELVRNQARQSLARLKKL